MTTNTPCSLRLPLPLRERVRVRAVVERRTFANQVRVLLERALDDAAVAPRDDCTGIDQAEIERLAELYDREIARRG